MRSVKEYQQILAYLNILDASDVDGQNGPLTRSKLFTFQMFYHDLCKDTDAEFGPVTNKAMTQVVKEMQTLLKKKGYYKDTIDGIPGKNTVAATKKLQKEYKIDQTGEFDYATQKKAGLLPIARLRIAQMISAAEKWIGTKEPKGDDKIIKKFGEITGIKLPYDAAWCAMATSVWTYESKNNDILLLTQFADYYEKDFRRAGRLYTYRQVPARGMLIMWDFDPQNHNASDHVELITSVSTYPDGTYKIKTIGGNNDISGQPDGVWRHTYRLSSTMMFGLPPYWKARK